MIYWVYSREIEDNDYQAIEIVTAVAHFGDSKEGAINHCNSLRTTGETDKKYGWVLANPDESFTEAYKRVWKSNP